jgi:hypothetical protein
LCDNEGSQFVRVPGTAVSTFSAMHR